MADKVTGTMIVILVIGALLGAGGMYYYDQTTTVPAAYQQGMAVAPQAVLTAAKLDYTWDVSGTFDFTGDVVNGTVPAQVDNSDELYIANVDPTYDATGLVVTLKNPKTGASGLDADLTDALGKITITIDYGTTYGITLLKDSTFHDRSIGDLTSGATTYIGITVTLEKNLHDVLTDGQAYDCTLYVWQPGADNVDSVDFIIQA